ATACLCSLGAVLTPSCPTGSAFAFSARPPLTRLQRRHQTATGTGTATPYRTWSNTASPTAVGFTQDTFIEVDDGRGDNDEDDLGDDDAEDEFDDDDIHPSVAWLYPASSSDCNNGSRTGDKKPKRKPSRRTLCVDYGTRRVGLAIGVGISPRTVPGITNRGSDLEVARQVLIRARGEGIRDIVVGLPLVSRNGTETEMCEIVRGFSSVLADVGAASRPTADVFLWDERFSSAQAGAMLDPHGGGMSGKVEIDSLSASIILEHFFEGGGTDSAERVLPSSGVVPAEVLSAAGREEADEGEEREEDAFGEGSRRRFQEMREESARSAAAGGNAVQSRKSRKRRKR
ncbi:unnamed protein product, partial [Scytosiphon promiscuus]